VELTAELAPAPVGSRRGGRPMSNGEETCLLNGGPADHDQTTASRVCGDGPGGRAGQVHPPDARQVRPATAKAAAGHDVRAILAAANCGLAAPVGGAEHWGRQARNFHADGHVTNSVLNCT
jgi:hypothetical protein